MMIIKLKNIWHNFDGPVFFKQCVDVIAILLIFFVGLSLQQLSAICPEDIEHTLMDSLNVAAETNK